MIPAGVFTRFTSKFSRETGIFNLRISVFLRIISTILFTLIVCRVDQPKQLLNVVFSFCKSVVNGCYRIQKLYMQNGRGIIQFGNISGNAVILVPYQIIYQHIVEQDIKRCARLGQYF
ncbi:hypothetical protein Barb7_02598 [Bacteroidales bacterium Barb7]|nr:hypothetical protein Barb7_02598 [Bacteroidales bacterium Barb7]